MAGPDGVWRGWRRSDRLEFGPFLAELPHHGFSDFLRGGAARKLISGREQKSFETGRARRDIAHGGRIPRDAQKILFGRQPLGSKLVGNVEHGPAFRHYNNVHKNVAAGDLVEDLSRRHGLVEKILARLQDAPPMAKTESDECDAAVNYAILLQEVGDFPARRSARNVDENLRLRISTVGTPQFASEP